MSTPPPLPSTKPAIVTTASRILYATLLVGVVRSCLEWNRLTATLSTGPLASNATAQNVAVGVTVFSMVATFAFMFWLIFMMDGGRNWARITYLVLFIVGIPLSVPFLIKSLSQTPISGALGLLQLAMQAGALVMDFSSTARLWFQPRN